MASNQTRPNCIFVSSAWIVWWFLDSKGPKSKYGNGRPFWQFMIAKMADQVWNNHKQSKRTVIRTDKTGGSSLELQVRDRKKSFRFFFRIMCPLSLIVWGWILQALRNRFSKRFFEIRPGTPVFELISILVYFGPYLVLWRKKFRLVGRTPLTQNSISEGT